MRDRSFVWLAKLGLAALLAGLAGCPSDDDDAKDTRSNSDKDAGSDKDARVQVDASAQSGSSEIVGSFNVSLVAPTSADPSGHTSVLGKVYDGPSLEQVIYEAQSSEGGCKLLTPRVPFCAAACGGSAICVDDDTCAPYPAAHGVGTVTLKGAKTTTGESEFTMKPIANGYQPAGGITLPFPAFDEGDTLRVEATGGDYSAFTIEAIGIAPLELAAGELKLERDKPFALAWTAPGKASRARVLLKLDISHHGGTKGKIECEVDDTGSLELSAAMITKLLDLGVAGYPTVVITREAIGTTQIAPGRVALRVDSIVEQSVTIPGLSSCSKNEDCASGETCQTDSRCK